MASGGHFLQLDYKLVRSGQRFLWPEMNLTWSRQTKHDALTALHNIIAFNRSWQVGFWACWNPWNQCFYHPNSISTVLKSKKKNYMINILMDIYMLKPRCCNFTSSYFMPRIIIQEVQTKQQFVTYNLLPLKKIKYCILVLSTPKESSSACVEEWHLMLKMIQPSHGLDAIHTSQIPSLFFFWEF